MILKFFSFKVFVSLSILCVISINTPLYPQSPPISNECEHLRDTLNKFRNESDQGNFIEALNYGREYVRNSRLFENNCYLEQESLLWEVSMAHLEYLDRINENPSEARVCAEKAYQSWKRYIDWYSKLNDAAISSLPAGNRRIKMAASHLGNSIIRSNQLTLVLNEYEEISIDYLGVDAINVWKNALYGCLGNNPSTPHTSYIKRKNLQNEECREHWERYAKTLLEWTHLERLTPKEREKKISDGNQILQEIRTITITGG